MRIALLCWCLVCSFTCHSLPSGFVYLDEYAPDILQDIRYATYHNFVGRPVDGYTQERCILTKVAARQLAKAQQHFKRLGYGLKVYDCYRPTRAVKDFMTWIKKPDQQTMKAEFYPHTAKKDFFKRGYVAKHSGHSRGSTVDLTLVHLPAQAQASYHRGQALQACYAPVDVRFKDNSIDMGTGFDCFDIRSYLKSTHILKEAHKNRIMLRRVMNRYGFKPYRKEWWHFTLRHEPYPRRYFDFLV